MAEQMQAGQFKAKCLKVMDKVKKTRKGIIITKRNVSVAKIVPIEEKEKTFFGKLKGTIHYKGNIIAPIGEEWDTNR